MELILLGAGASVDAKLPTAVQATDLIRKRLEAIGPNAEPFVQVLNFVLGCIAADRGVRLLNPFEGIDIETVYNALMFLADSPESDAKPFVSAWNPTIIELDVVGPNMKAFENALQFIRENINVEASRGLVDYSFQRAVTEIGLKPGNGRVFRETANAVAREMQKICLEPAEDAFDYLAPLLNLVPKYKRLPIATLNYDMGVESVSRSHGVGCHTGLRAWVEKGYAHRPLEGVNLIKLHGSVNWIMQRVPGTADKPIAHSDVSESGGLYTDPENTIFEIDEWMHPGRIRRVLDSKDPGTEHLTRAVIFGHRNKLTTDGPYLDLLMDFREELGLADLVTVIGYSFRDKHINDLLSKWLNSDVNRKVRVVAPHFEQNATGFAKDLINSLNPFGRIEIVEQTAAIGLRQIYGDFSPA